MVILGVFIVVAVLVAIIGFFVSRSKRQIVIASWYYYTVCLLIAIRLFIAIAIWSMSLKVVHNYGDNWRFHTQDRFIHQFQNSNNCCGYIGPNDYSSPKSTFCLPENVTDSTVGCAAVIGKIIGSHYNKYYSVLFLFLMVDLFTLFSGVLLVVTIKANERLLINQNKYIFGSNAKKEGLVLPLSNFLI
ncbi:hypothetical protein AYI70_g12197 [Smittium culicis]|uniref:Uncharacterized protein n=1 Tax=Smittium culicis TaxID=133412 RepID=A0A1R1WYH9_9FUNG|nr:hypothetical protein AYI70_g12197 [Smittium culicis]